MASSVTDIYNWALSIAGARQSVSNSSNDGRETEVCDLWYPIVRDTVLRAAPWPSARYTSRLALYKKYEGDLNDWVTGDVEPGWRFAYSYPSDMLRPRFLVGYENFVTGMIEPQKPVIYTNVEKAILTYTMQQKMVGALEPDLQLAIAHGLAANICLPLNGKTERINYALQLANQKIIDARVAAANQDEYQVETLPEWFQARGYGSSAQLTRFIYPHGALLQPPNGWQAHK